MTTTNTPEDVLDFITRRVLPDLERIINTEGSEDVGAFAPVGRYGQSRGYGQASSLADWLQDIVDVLDEYTQGAGEDDLAGWHLADAAVVPT
jgi:hypothetical protein